MKFLKGNGTDSAIEGGAVPASSAGAAAAGVATKQAGKDAIALESPLEGEAVAEKVAREVELAGLDRSVLSAHAIGEAASTGRSKVVVLMLLLPLGRSRR